MTLVRSEVIDNSDAALAGTTCCRTPATILAPEERRSSLIPGGCNVRLRPLGPVNVALQDSSALIGFVSPQIAHYPMVAVGGPDGVTTEGELP
jgi:hypothetical protein